MCIGWMLFGVLPINAHACFHENSPKRRLVNLSEIISKAGGVIDCGSGGERKSGRPDINIQLPIFHLSHNYQFIQLRKSFRKETLCILPFCTGFVSMSLINTSISEEQIYLLYVCPL